MTCERILLTATLTTKERQRLPELYWNNVVETLAVSTDRILVRELIQGVTRAVYSKYSKDRMDRPAVFVNVSKPAREAGLFPRTRNGDIGIIYEYLSESSVPVWEIDNVVRHGSQKGTVQRYRFTTMVFKEEARGLLEMVRGPVFEAMRKPPVVSVGPIPEVMPTTDDLERNRRRQYERVFKLLAGHGITNIAHLRKIGIRLSGIIGENPPVTVFECDDRLYVAKVNSEELEAFLGESLMRIKQERDNR